MSKRYWYIYLIVLTSTSCDNFVFKKDNRKDIIQKKWSEVDKNEVDQPPLFKTCQYKTEKELERCFQNTITKHIQDHLIDHTFKVQEAINDTVWVPLLITKDGEIILEEFLLPDIIQNQVPDFKTVLEASISSLPEAEPAHTRGTPTSARYKLPLVIDID
ncbi:hypothetical protein [Aquimarina sp. MMG016]|uniref:hypothetical protein n=1 Tax=Aquimarina sp. MMG016 TaxID=2822690 RepID=UPI001B3A744C|nr:hypothetical protein [Aquimarina sp. MMG016]MBQ4820892.1 hypothetical protein [Aquimarina sp. MMG016]